MDLTSRQQHIIHALLKNDNDSLSNIIKLPEFSEITERTLQRDINELIKAGLVKRHGEARAITYSVTLLGRIGLTLPDQLLEQIFAEEERNDLRYDFERLDILRDNKLFTAKETSKLDEYNAVFQGKLKTASQDIIRRERERITIELSWKSSQFEGNTYSLIETETLLKEGLPAPGKTQEETTMVLNHKKALDFAESHKDLFASQLDMRSVIELHRLLAVGLFEGGIRERLVGITGSAYKPLENKFQIEEELKRLCDVISSKSVVYEKALLAFSYICYLQPFNDGNKRTGRILANAILYANNCFPLSLRAVNVNTYKLAILAFYELGIIGNVKQVFTDQAKFAAENYAI
jgi:fido (protein-threonine AMPylation protein)/predicted transcriptional regulator